MAVLLVTVSFQLLLVATLFHPGLGIPGKKSVMQQGGDHRNHQNKN